MIRKGRKVLFVSAEMTKEEIATRLLSIESGVPADLLINKPNHLKTTELDAISRVVSRLAEKHCFLLDEPNVRSDRLFLAAGSAEQQMGGLDFVVVDYLQILEGRTKQHIRSKADYLAEIVKDLKALAKRHNVPVLALAQLNRDSEHGKPSLRHFADTSQLEKESDVAMILCREKRDLGGWDHQLRREKNRNGRTGLIRLYFDEQRMYFSEEAA
jgi:replicative DNA helicase